MKVLLGPINNAGQPIALTKELRRQGVEAHCLTYQNHKYGYGADKEVCFDPYSRVDVQFQTLQECLKEDYDIYHFWFRSLFYGGFYEYFTGLDLPIIKNRGKKIVHSFTGFDLRFQSECMQKNPYNVFQYGWKNIFSEESARKYLNFLRYFVDEFVVLDEELQSYLPEAKIIPRVLDLDEWEYIGIKETDCPLVVHAPSSPAIKGTPFVNQAVQQLKEKGLKFEYREVTDLKHRDAMELYKRADIVIDQLLIGWYGVLTVEAMALGKPVMVYIQEDLYQPSQTIPVENVNPDNLTEKLRNLIQDFDRRKDLSRRGRAYVESVHDVKKVTKKLIGLYESVLKEKERREFSPESFDDLLYFKEQYIDSVGAVPYKPLLKQKTVQYEKLVQQLNQLRPKANRSDRLQEEVNQLTRKLKKYEGG
ncbi:glycosyltransferase [Melghirimyces algeriensis]|uniref:Glycosyltransferase involved in cell wall bisynthesis n=1 Tax=Melghirimyces algeriensis TaxID=910412 RepID=A0A521CAP6_9BACL|nr:glycosyltransferase [Melghirimyces algeriensis]SMO56499.1 Glycosyltransferase involved in cell wall bisynthesis [Melghirimyces algeriensis]